MSRTVTPALRFLAVLALAALIAAACGGGSEAPSAAPSGPFPLRISPDRHHLQDRHGSPFLYAADTGWNIFAAGLTIDQAHTYFQDRKDRGFTAIQTHLLPWNPGHPDAKDVQPFKDGKVLGALSSPYFDHAAQLVDEARKVGLLVVVAPIWLDNYSSELAEAGTDAVERYGEAVGRVLRPYPNVIWMLGGDKYPAGKDTASMEALARGIRTGAPHQLLTAHSGACGSAVENFASIHPDIDTAYGYSKDYVDGPCDVPDEIARGVERSPKKPLLFIEGYYDSNFEAYGSATSDEQRSRRQAYWSILGGASGFAAGEEPLFEFDPGWEALLDRPLANQAGIAQRFFSSLPWQELVPDHGKLLRSDPGTGSDTVVAAATPDHRTVAAYLPVGGSVTVATGLLGEGTTTARWFDPGDGTSRDAGAVERPAQSFTAPATNSRGPGNADWVLLLETSA